MNGSTFGDLMKYARLLTLAMLFPLPAAGAQQPVAPPPRPGDNGPSLEDTVKLIHDKLIAQGDLKWATSVTNSGATWGDTNTGTFTDVRMEGHCSIYLRYRVISTYSGEPGMFSHGYSFHIQLGEVEKLDVTSAQAIEADYRSKIPDGGVPTYTPDFLKIRLYPTEPHRFIEGTDGDESSPGTIGTRISYKSPANGQGVLLTRIIDKDSPAAVAGLKDGDVVTEIAGQPVHSVDELKAALLLHPPGATIEATYLRGSDSGIAKIVLGNNREIGYKTNLAALNVRNEDTADRLAKAFVHAIELCRGGNKDSFPSPTPQQSVVPSLSPQQVVPPPPRPAEPPPTQAAPSPKPTDNGPSLPDTLNYIKTKLMAIGELSQVRIMSDGSAQIPTIKITDVTADPAACTLQTKASSNHQPEFITTVMLQDVRSISVSLGGSEDVQPRFYNLNIVANKPTIRFEPAPPSAPVNKHRGKDKTPEQSIPPSTGKVTAYYFDNEEDADRTAKALLHAVELCGAGTSKELF